MSGKGAKGAKRSGNDRDRTGTRAAHGGVEKVLVQG